MMPRKLTKQATSSSIASASTSTSAPAVPASLPGVLSDGLPLPRAVVFDLDYTLWPFWVDTHVSAPPLRANADHSAVADRVGESFAFYADVPGILHGLRLAGARLAVASRTHRPDLGREMLKLLHVPGRSSVLGSADPTSTGDPEDGGGGGGSRKDAKDREKENRPRKAIDFFDGGLEIYPSSKVRHFEALHRRTGIPYDQMLFFDDESRNRDTEALGVTMWLVRDGVTWDEVVRGIREWRRRRGIREEQ